jgi:ADP-ribose pyrophosphatase YjhB (NUDIX family)
VTVRFCIRCGRRVRRERTEGRWRRRCPACGWTYYGNPVPAAGALIVRGSLVLLVRRGRPPYKGMWDVPGGFLEGDESAETALRRELHEELGVRTVSIRFIGSASDSYGARGFPVLSLIYRARIRGRPRPSDDVSSAEWMERSRIPWRRIPFKNLRSLLRSHLRGMKRG